MGDQTESRDNFSQRKVLNDISVKMYIQPLKVAQSVKCLKLLLTVIWTWNYLYDYYETEFNHCYPINLSIQKSIHGPCLYSSNCIRQNMKTLAWSDSKPCLYYARRALDSTFIYKKDERSSPCSVVSVEQCVLPLVNNWWQKASDNNTDIVNFTYQHQTNNGTKMPFNSIKGNRFL